MQTTDYVCHFAKKTNNYLVSVSGILIVILNTVLIPHTINRLSPIPITKQYPGKIENHNNDYCADCILGFLINNHVIHYTINSQK